MAIERQWQISAEPQETKSFITVNNNAPLLSSTKVKTGARSISMLGSGSTPGGVISGSHTTVRLGYWLNHEGWYNMVCLYIASSAYADPASYNNAFFWVELASTKDYFLIKRPSLVTAAAYDTLATYPIPQRLLDQNSWMHIGAIHYIHATTGYVSIYIDGIKAFTHTGDTRPYGQGSGVGFFMSNHSRVYGGGAYRSTFGFVGWSSQTYLDDMYCDSYDGEPDVAPPSKRFFPSYTDGPGQDAQFTSSSGSPNWQNVDELPPNDDTDFNHATAANLRDTFTTSNVTVPQHHNIVAAVPIVYAKRLNAGIDSQINLSAYDGLSYKDGADKSLVLDYYPNIWDRFVTQPDGSAWDEASFNAMQFGYRSRGTF